MLYIAFDPLYELSLPDGHRFPMLKYRLIPEQLVYEGTVTEAHFFRPTMPEDSLFETVHAQEYLRRMNQLALSPQEMRKIGFPLSEALIAREKVIMNGTWLCAKYALVHGVSMNVAGGTHHAFRNRGEGFCLLNDIAVAAGQLLKLKLAKKILVIDLDVHQGNGTAEIFRNENRVFTFSVHGQNNYPAQKEKSDWDIPLPNGVDDRTYLELLDRTLPELFEKTNPDFVFYQSGVDVLATDRLGKFSLTLQGCRERDKKVLLLCKYNKIPIVASMGGGYSERIATIVEAHANTFRLAQEIFF